MTIQISNYFHIIQILDGCFFVEIKLKIVYFLNTKQVEVTQYILNVYLLTQGPASCHKHTPLHMDQHHVTYIHPLYMRLNI